MRIGITTNLNNNSYIALRLIRNASNTFNFLLIGQFCNILHQFWLHDAIRQFSNHNTLATIIFRLYICIGANHDSSATGLKRISNARNTINSTACREVRSFYILHQSLNVNLRIVDICHTTINHFAEVMRRHIRSHTYGNTTCTIHEQVGEAARQNGWFAKRVVEVQLHIHRILLDIAQHLFCKFGKTCFGITHSSCTIAVDWAEVTLPVNQRITHCPRLRQTHQRTINRTVAMRVILTHYLTYDTRRFLRRLIARITQLVHSEQHTAMHRLKTITHIRKRTRHNYTHWIVNIRGSHLLFNIHLQNSVFFNHILYFCW